jgi:prolyl-tRNA synthetase
MGIPHRFVIGERGLAAGNLEYRHRLDSNSTEVAVAGALDHVQKRSAA